MTFRRERTMEPTMFTLQELRAYWRCLGAWHGDTIPAVWEREPFVKGQTSPRWT